MVVPDIKKYLTDFLDSIDEVFSSSSDDDDYNSSDYDFNSSDDENNKFSWANESNILPHFKDIADAIQNDDVNQLHIAIDNFTENIDKHSIDGETVLHHACNCLSRRSFEFLVGKGANLEARNKGGAIPLHTACELGLFKIVEFIFNNVKDGDTINRMLHSVDLYDQTPFHEAVAGGNINIVKLLLDIETRNSGSINKMIEAVDIFGETPLHTSALNGNAKIAKLLLEVGASTQKTNSDGKFPYELAKPNSEVRKILEGIH